MIGADRGEKSTSKGEGYGGADPSVFCTVPEKVRPAVIQMGQAAAEQTSFQAATG